MPRRKQAPICVTNEKKRRSESTDESCIRPAPDNLLRHSHAVKTRSPSSTISNRSEHDLVSKLPDDVLLNVFSHLDSPLDRLRVAAVDTRFRKCMFKAMKTPQPLHLDFDNQLLSGHQLPKTKWPAVVQLLAKEARFDQINICYSARFPKALHLSYIFHVLLSAPNCLTRLTKINISACLCHGGSADGLDLVLAKCAKLSVIKLSPPVKLHNPSDPVDHYYPTLDLVSSLRDKPVTELHLCIVKFSPQEMIDFLHSLQHNTLLKLDLDFRSGKVVQRVYVEVDLVQFVRVLCLTAAESIQDIRFTCTHTYDFSLAQLFTCIPQLPALSRLVFEGQRMELEPLEELIPAVKLLLSSHDRATPVAVEYHRYFKSRYPTCCKLLTLMQSLRKEQPKTVCSMDVNQDDDDRRWKWRVSLGNVSFMLHTNVEECEAPTCHQCHSCFPVVIEELSQLASRRVNGHLDNYWLDRCKIEHVVTHQCMEYTGALHAQENAAHDLATITFRRKDGTQFQITVATGQCFEQTCIRCLPID